jgi:A/G-specific adenine glycosylase
VTALRERDRIRARLLSWYDANRRDLPWRSGSGRAPEPYRVWISEVMLQQTRVETVRPYFERWMTRFPTLEALADAPLDDVLKAWEGLGYYSRARNLHGAAREVATRYGGQLPGEAPALRTLPGIGRYTAGAVASIAFGRAEPVVDGNVRRVLARWLDDPAPRDPRLWKVAEELVAGERPGDLNQALMELGATVCTPRSPGCGDCPVREWCVARSAGTQEQRPVPRGPRSIPEEEHGVAVVEWNGSVLMTRRTGRGRLAGLWELPGAAVAPGETAAAAARRAVRERTGLEVVEAEPLGAVEHAFTHVRVTYRALRCAPAGAPPPLATPADSLWADAADVERLALPRAQRRLLSLAAERGVSLRMRR